MKWTLRDFTTMDRAFEFKVKNASGCPCKAVKLDQTFGEDFTAYVSGFDFKRPSAAVLYGRVSEAGEVSVHCAYEPPQNFDAASGNVNFVDVDPRAEQVVRVTKLLGLTRVGWIFSHGDRDVDMTCVCLILR